LEVAVVSAEELGTINPMTVEADEPLAVAAAMMKRHHIHHLPVVAKGCMIGMLSTRDLVGMVPEIANRDGKSARPQRPLDAGHHLKVQDVHSADVCSIPCEATIYRAAWLMVQHRIRSLPLIRDQRVVGILTDSDLLRACISGIARVAGTDPTVEWRRNPVAEFMTSEVRTVEPTASVLHAWMLMREHDVSHLAVMRNDGLNLVSGIVSDDDVDYALRGSQTNDHSASAPAAPPRISLREIMTREVVMIGKYDKLAKAAEAMLSNDIAALLVMDSCLEGIITRRDLLRALIKA
jgi:CBS domain-containing membrane protein